MKRKIWWIGFWMLGWLPLLQAQQNRMYVPGENPEVFEQLRQLGAQFSREDLYDPSAPSFNDAVVHFNGGCSGGVISPQGLIITNHHCGYSAIQSHSTLEHNYVKDGFWSKSLEEELPNPGMYVTFVRQIINVTDEVLKGVTPDMPENERQAVVEKNIRRLKKEIPKKDWQEIQIKPYLYGNLYYALITETFRDIRLVGAPPSAIGKFGADTDNWMWPRHSGDFALFRIYADKNNRPAEYSPDNVPYRPEKYFRVSTDGVEERDLILVYGFPGRTRQYLPSFAVEQITRTLNPVRIEARERALNIMDEYMRRNDTLKLMYTAHFARVANYWKKWKGENLGIDKADALERKKEMEKKLKQYAAEKQLDDELQSVLDSLKILYDEMEDPALARALIIETMYINNDWMRRAFTLYALAQAGEQEYNQKKDQYYQRLMREYRSTDNRISRPLFEAMLAYYNEKMPEAYKNPAAEKYPPEVWSDTVAQNSVLADSLKLKDLFNRSYEDFLRYLKNDSGYDLAQRLITDYYRDILPDYTKKQNQMNRLMRRYTSIIMQSGLYPDLVPDANGTLRFSFGRVEGYEPRDGVYYEPISTIDGVIEKYIPGDYEFDLPEEFLKIYREKDFGPYAVNGTVPVNFLGTAHTTGGNSGSPVLNAEGELVGVNFDRVWEGTMSDLFYDPTICRNIMVDMRYVLFIIDKLGKAPNLIYEITPAK